MKLHELGFNFYSQFGEDGMIEAVLGWVGKETRTCVEFGAWDGLHLSNTAHLWKDQLWKGILLEADPVKAADAKKNAAGFDVEVFAVELGTGPGGRVDDFVKCAVDVVSIDVDGNDIHLFRDTKLRPSLFVVEFNPTIPAHLEIEAPYSLFNRFGCGLGSLCAAAKEKDYSFVGASRTNGFFVRNDLMPKMPGNLDKGFAGIPSEKDLVYLMTDYNGEFVASGIGPYGRTHHYLGKVNGIKS